MSIRTYCYFFPVFFSQASYWAPPAGSQPRRSSVPDVELSTSAFTEAGAELVLTGHEHNYERFAEMNIAQLLDHRAAEPRLTVINDVAVINELLSSGIIAMISDVLMLAAAGGLWFLHKGRTGLLLAGSGALWLAFQMAPSQMQVPWPVDGNTTFNFAAWQLLFFTAMAIGFHRDNVQRKLSAMPRLPYLMFSGLLLVWLARLYGTQGALLSRFMPEATLQQFMQEFFLKSSLAPGRLIASFIVFQFAYLAATLWWRPIWAALGWLLLPLGQNALYAYTMHVAVIGLFYTTLPHLPLNVLAMGTLNTSLQLLTILAIWWMIQRRFLFRIVPR